MLSTGSEYCAWEEIRKVWYTFVDSFYTWRTGWKWKCKSYTYEHVSHKENYFRWWIFFAWLWGVCDSILYVGLWPKGITHWEKKYQIQAKFLSWEAIVFYYLFFFMWYLLIWCDSLYSNILKTSWISLFNYRILRKYLTKLEREMWYAKRNKKYKGIFEKHIGCLT